MRIAIISDIHSNLIALEAVFEEIEHIGVDRVVCLGDVVGYGPAPNECVELIQQKADVCLMGNHDWAVLGREDLAYFNVFAREAVIWSQKRLKPQAADFLRSLPFVRIEEECTFVHSAPLEPQAWTYVINKHDARLQLAFLQTLWCFVGHTHVAGVFQQRNESVNYLLEANVALESGNKYLINVGSVGQPRDFDPRASFGILDTERRLFQFHRVPYDIESTQFSMKRLGLPRYLIERLAYGR